MANTDKRTEVLKDILRHSEFQFAFIGRAAFLRSKNNFKVICTDTSLIISAIDRTEGGIDRTELPFSHYFAQVRCSTNAPLWTPSIDGNDWRFPQYKHCHPTEKDFIAIAEAVDNYIWLFN